MQVSHVESQQNLESNGLHDNFIYAPVQSRLYCKSAWLKFWITQQLLMLVCQISAKCEVGFMGYMDKFFHGIMQIRFCDEAVDGNWN
jgi:hypothetical protein